MISQNRITALDEELVIPEADEYSSVGQLLPAIWRHRWALVVLPLISLIVAALYLARSEKLYSSTARIYVQQNGPKILSSQDLTTYSNDFLETQCEFIGSTPILADAVASMKSLKTFSGAENPVSMIKGALDVNVQKGTEIINISFRSPYPEDSGQIVNAIVESYVNYQSTQKKSTAAEVLKILEAEKEKQDAELDQKLKALLEFKQKNGVLSFETTGGNIINQKFAALSQELTQAEYDTIEARALANAAKKVGDDPDKLQQLLQSQQTGVSINMGQGDSQPGQDLHQDQRALRELMATYGPNHPLVKIRIADIGGTQSDVAEMNKAVAERYRSVIDQRVLLAEQKSEELRHAYETQRTEALNLNAQAAEYSKLDSDVKRIENLSDILDNRIKELNVTEDHDVLSTSILELAKSGKLVWPRSDQVIAIALVLGLILGIASAIGLDLFDQRLRSVDDVRRSLSLQVMGVIPHMLAKESTKERGQKVALLPMSDVSEAYRTLRTALYFSVARGKKLLVTSPAPGDGKTTTASNLAIAIAQAGQRTLLIDADFRKPTQHRVFELNNDKGLMDVLKKAQSIETVIRPTTIDGLDVLTCGSLPSNPAEVLNSQPFRDLVNDLAQKYDHVLIDSPPVAPVTDAQILGGICDATLIVLRADKSNRKLAAHAKESLQSVGANILGVVVNDVPRGREQYGYYYGGYQYGYGNGEAGGRRRDFRNELGKVTSAVTEEA